MINPPIRSALFIDKTNGRQVFCFTPIRTQRNALTALKRGLVECISTQRGNLFRQQFQAVSQGHVIMPRKAIFAMLISLFRQ